MPAILDERLWFPDPRKAFRLEFADGLVAIGGNLSVERLLLAYRSGIFPWTVNPLTWWSPDPRGVFEFDGFHIPRSLRQVLRRDPYEVRMDTAFRSVVEGCASQPRPGSWISGEFIRAYTRLHEAGYAHGVETWRDGELTGGIYGVAIGGLFAGESMFHRADHASKVALVRLWEHLRVRGFVLFDIQMVTHVTEQFGAVTIPRREYLRRLERAMAVRASF
jgi:leucyl/phenylalanyl-tRNA--protein transferase